MLKAIVTNGVIKPLHPLPEDWKDGTEVQVERFEPGAELPNLRTAHFEPPSTIRLIFTDASFSLSIERLEMPVDRILWDTAAASPTGDCMIVKAIKGEVIPIASGTLRYLVDEKYAAKIDAALKASQFTRDELEELARNNPPPPAWYDQPQQDLRFESWK